ncbi:MAG: hypothetical protein HFH68_08230 [Lachnospiraceae bacterium]|nr:hypothetical protein [Lachnospiraceae bacterium]
METINELEKYLEDECYSFNEISIGKHYAYEGIIIKKIQEKYIFGYSERGNMDIIKSFEYEKDLVNYAFEALSTDEWAKAHLVAWTWSEPEIINAEKELKDMDIKFKRNDIPNYSKNTTAYRIFVFGKDTLRLDSFRAKYFMK